MVDVFGNFFQLTQIDKQIERIRGCHSDICVRVALEHIQVGRNDFRVFIFMKQANRAYSHLRIRIRQQGTRKIVEGDKGIVVRQSSQLLEQRQLSAENDAGPNIQKSPQFESPDI